jgi:hypothetical protein
VLIAVGELALFVALVDRWATRSGAGAWSVTLTGLAVSVAGNVGHVTGHSLTVRTTAAVPPLAAAPRCTACRADDDRGRAGRGASRPDARAGGRLAGPGRRGGSRSRPGTR